MSMLNSRLHALTNIANDLTSRLLPVLLPEPQAKPDVAERPQSPVPLADRLDDMNGLAAATESRLLMLLDRLEL